VAAATRPILGRLPRPAVFGTSVGLGAARRAPGDAARVARAAGWYGAPVADRRLYVTDAIVLSRFDYGEADRILTILTPGLGKIKAIAKGIRRPTSRIGGSLEPLA
jgi:hypothetical protein